MALEIADPMKLGTGLHADCGMCCWWQWRLRDMGHSFVKQPSDELERDLRRIFHAAKRHLSAMHQS